MVLTLVALLLSGCKSRAVEEAREVVAVADSLRAEGVAYADSIAMAEEYKTIEKWQYIYPTDYARACYYYGRLLRAKDDPVSAMQVFINGTHSRSKDYHILGRIYSNMGSISHLAGEYQLAYDMYSRSADLFLQSGDTLLYYYGLNAMALECATQGQREETKKLVQEIYQQCSDTAVIVRALEMEAEMYFQRQQYDSALYYASQALKKTPNSISALLITAQSYSFMHIGDSAVHYAHLVLSNTSELHNINNALYVLTNDDASKDKDAIKETAAARSDIQKLIEIRQGKLSQATQLLQQDLNKPLNLIWLYSIFGTCVLIGSALWVYIICKKKRQQLLSQQVENLEYQAKTSIESMRTRIEEACITFARSSNIEKDLSWKDYDAMTSKVNHHFFMLATKLQNKGLTEKEIRLCVLTLLNFGYDEMANLLYYSPNGVGKFKMRTAKKIGATAKKLRDFLITMAVAY